MNFIELQSRTGRSVFINLSTVTCITQDSNGMAKVCFDGQEHINLDEMYADLISTIEAIQRRNGR